MSEVLSSGIGKSLADDKSIVQPSAVRGVDESIAIPPSLRIASSSSTILSSCGSNRDAARKSNARAINRTKVAENIEIKQTASAFFHSI
jgi:hypothetical protein